MKLAATIGVFDGVHNGHKYLLDQLKETASEKGLPTLAVTFSRHPLEVIAPQRAPKLITSLKKRVELLYQAGVDRVVVMDFSPELRSKTAAEFVDYLSENFGVSDLVMGFNHSIGCDRVIGESGYKELSSATGVTIHKAKEYAFRTSNGNSISSSSIRNELLNGDISAANNMLGYNFILEGTVVGGQQLGRTLGFPTANLNIDSGLIIPRNGVYASDVTLADGRTLRSMVNIGQRPTIDNSDHRTSVEVNIFDFEGNLYGNKLQVEFLTRLRDEQKFANLEQLKQQLTVDRQAALRVRNTGSYKG